MRQKDLILSEKKADDTFLKKCIFNEWNKDKVKDMTTKILAESNNSEEFIDKFLGTKELSHTQAYAELSKTCRPDKHWYKIREMFGDRQFKTGSDAGSVKIGNDSFTVLVPNGEGDGITRVAVFDSPTDRQHFNDSMMKPFTLIDGDFNIYNYDCGESVAKKLSGRYYIYVYQGLVAFVKL